VKKFLAMLLVASVLLAGMTMTVGCGGDKPADTTKEKKEKEKEK